MRSAGHFDHGRRLGTVKDLDVQLSEAFFKTSAIAFCIVDDQRRFRFVNDALVAMHNGIPAEAFAGSTIREIIGDAAPDAEARLDRLCVVGEIPAIEVIVKLPLRAEPGYWIEKNFPIKSRSGKILQIASLGIEITAQRELEGCFRELAGELLFRNDEYQRLARELHESINGYHEALKANLERLSRCSSDPERIPELLVQSTECLDGHMQKLASAVARCFPLAQQH